MTRIDQLLAHAAQIDSPTAQLDAELLLAFVLEKPRSYLYTWPDKTVTEAQVAAFMTLLERRQRGEPVAYLLGRQGFWTLDLQVAKHTLIPRADTELLVESALQLADASSTLKVLDLGTGTGALALALASERPLWAVTGVDRIESAVALAQNNQRQLQLANVEFLSSHWFSALTAQRYDLIVSNPPYIADNDPHLQQGDVRFEPLSALVSGPDGLDDIRLIIAQAPSYLTANGWLLLEHGFDQASAVRELLQQAGFIDVSSQRDLSGHQRISLGRLPSLS
ncbi:MAG: peptide chain release factor N(5)-glutamine methyltransferase [Thiopseudomonas sp.]|jgi:release factor glutamine methyltransferase|uniref:peptide chain release factor N(5)-glutamine methyltransferase n=1 Tax=Denitrificimonas caeni TaxID=521720 RepID=UPI0003B4D315|nr:peptide chain release factor N(5)-glutamine methyltransferase [Denitrificimonas caeni]MBP7188716.1 peptide chain release factor N(5)-glutamine methyltransferase [Thiopseudomonas sp.]HAB90786.1 peptide chain release factor N(5)-glutamine methyltransferase [Pseudomonas sp.]MBP8007545.1 peptide chain release factor N(5)-glutamine methyltransferase [Thiopseudomonas sp.]MBP8770239.1 peptide chain release factor N(5)-glutamine methyltransferase [Thiopseudomonas sp.]MBP9614417.1 peptide chain rele